MITSTAPDGTLLYKWLDGQESCHGGSGKWTKGRWRSVSGELDPCHRGLHLCREDHLLSWIHSELWLAEIDDAEMIDHGDKIVVRKMRVTEKLNWDKRISRLFAADCAERVLPIFEKKIPNEDRPRLAIQAARDYANGLIDDATLAAARAAAWAAARAAAWDAARVAAWDAARVAAWDAARAAAWDAARAAAWDAARAAAWDAERAWQIQRLLDYAHNRIQ